MRTTLLPWSCALLLAPVPMQAQLLAGEVPDGMSVMDVDYTMTLTQPLTSDSISLEFDCDDFHDAWLMIHRDMPEVDGTSYAQIRFLDDTEVCASLTPAPQRRPKYYDFGAPLDCAGTFDWQAVDRIVLGDLGGFSAIGPTSIDSLYLTYRRDGVTGWMLLSFDLLGDAGTSMTIHRVLAVCPGPLSVEGITAGPGITLHPNPGSGDPIRVQSSSPLRSVEVVDATGRIVANHEGSAPFPSPDVVGTYLVRATFADGQRTTQRWVRY